MKKCLLFLGLIFLLISCYSYFSSHSGVRIIRHPDYNFPKTYSGNVRVYKEGFEPTYPYIIIAKLQVQGGLTGWMADPYSSKDTRMMRAAAEVGGDGVLVTHKDINMQEYNDLVTRGSVSNYTGFLKFLGVVTQTATYSERVSVEPSATYVWVIRRVNR